MDRGYGASEKEMERRGADGRSEGKERDCVAAIIIIIFVFVFYILYYLIC